MPRSPKRRDSQLGPVRVAVPRPTVPPQGKQRPAGNQDRPQQEPVRDVTQPAPGLTGAID